MAKKAKIRPTIGVAGQTHLNGFDFSSFSANTDYTTSILDLLPHGEVNAVSMEALSCWLDVSERTVRKIIQGKRLDGEMILSSTAGYYFPSEDERIAIFEIEAFKRLLSGKISTDQLIYDTLFSCA